MLTGNRIRVPIAVTFVLLLSLVAIGCGGSSQSEPLTKSEFVKQANVICATAQEERAGQPKEMSGSETDVETLTEPVEKMAEELGDLAAPAGQQKEVAALVASYEAGVSKLSTDPLGADSASAFAKANQLAADYGLSGCSI